MTEAQTPALEACPFCGCDPMPDFCSTNEGPAYSFHCHSKDCPAWPNVQGETEAEAIAAWNTRAKPALEPVAWMYEPTQRITQSPFVQFNRANMDPRYWTETALGPIETHPPADRALLDEVLRAAKKINWRFLAARQSGVLNSYWGEDASALSDALAKLGAKL